MKLNFQHCARFLHCPSKCHALNSDGRRILVNTICTLVYLGVQNAAVLVTCERGTASGNMCPALRFPWYLISGIYDELCLCRITDLDVLKDLPITMIDYEGAISLHER